MVRVPAAKDHPAVADGPLAPRSLQENQVHSQILQILHLSAHQYSEYMTIDIKYNRDLQSTNPREPVPESKKILLQLHVISALCLPTRKINKYIQHFIVILWYFGTEIWNRQEPESIRRTGISTGLEKILTIPIPSDNILLIFNNVFINILFRPTICST